MEDAPPGRSSAPGLGGKSRATSTAPRTTLPISSIRSLRPSLGLTKGATDRTTLGSMRAVGDTNADFLAEAFTILLFCFCYRPAKPDR